MSGRHETQLARRRAVKEPACQHAVIDHREPAPRDALAVEGMRTLAALAQRVVDDADARPKQALAELVLQEARLARDRCAVDRRRQMPDERARDPRIEHDRHASRLDLARIEALDGALARDPAGLG